MVEDGGFLYDSDAYNDDLPYYKEVAGKQHLVLPYAFDTNDMQFYNASRFRGDDFAGLRHRRIRLAGPRRGDRTEDDVDRPAFAHDRPARPHRSLPSDRILRHVTSSGAAWVAPRADIARHWLATFPDAP